MPSKFRLEMVVTLDKNSEAKVIESARQHYMRGGRAARRDDRDGPQMVPANEFIDGTEQALMELLVRNPGDGLGQNARRSRQETPIR